jgi:hypothetical protein
MSYRIVNESEIRTAKFGEVDKKFIWTLWYLGRKKEEFIGSFSSAGEANQWVEEFLVDSHHRRPAWRYLVHGTELGVFLKAGL